MKKKKKYIVGVLLLIIVCFIYNAISIRNYSKNYFETKSDVAIVLGAGANNGKLSKVFIERVNHAINLMNDNKIKAIIFTGGYGENQTISDSKAAKDYTIEKGIEESKLLIEEESTITFFNIKNAKDIMDNHNFSSALIISDPYHMKRSMHMCELIGIKALPSPTPTSMYRSRKTKFKFLISETINYWAYFLVGQHRSYK